LVLLIILYSGLTPKDFNRQHVASILPEGGLEFTKYSLVRTDPIDIDIFKPEPLFVNNKSNQKQAETENTPLSVSMSLVISKFADYNHNTFQLLATLSSGDASQQISIGQWENSILALRGNDYRNATGSPNLIFKLPQTILPQNKLVLHFSREMATIELNDLIMDSDSNISWMTSSNPFVVTLGNALQRTHGWSGALDEFELSIQTEQNPNVNNSEVDANNQLSKANSKNLLHYQFQTPYLENNQLLKNLSDSEINLHLESAWTVSSFDWLSEASYEDQLSLNLSADRLLNFLGFMPFGFLLMYTFYDRKRIVLIACATCFAGVTLSLGIETAQAMIPSRISSIQDLVLNSAGTVFGCVAAVSLSYFAEKFPGIKNNQ